LLDNVLILIPNIGTQIFTIENILIYNCSYIGQVGLFLHCVAVVLVDLMLEQLDVSTTFLHGNLKENVNMQQLGSFVE